MLTLVATSSGSFVPTAVTISGAKLLNIRHLTKLFRPYFFRLLKFQKFFTTTSHTPTPPSTQTHNLHSTRIPLLPLRRKSQKTPEIICMNKKNIITLHRKSRGKMPERSNGTVSKTVVPLRVPRVRIPVSPPMNRCSFRSYGDFLFVPQRKMRGVEWAVECGVRKVMGDWFL